MRPQDIAELVRVSRPPSPYGARRLALTYSIEDIARVARKRLARGARDYLEGGGEDEYTLRRNRTAFDDYEIIPSALHDVSEVDTATTALGSHLPVPIILSPVGGPRLLHHEGELAVARAARHAGIPYAVSTLATVPLERIAEETDGDLWFQLYLWGDRSVAKNLLAHAQQLGYRALLFSIDVNVRSKRERELHAGVKLPKPDLTLHTFLDGALHPSSSWHFLTSEAISFPNVEHARGTSTSATSLSDMFDGTVCWDDLGWIRDVWNGPIALKGILPPDDARRAADEGVDAIVVSNHGGRQLDHLPATIDVLPGIVDAVDGRVEVLFDSGIRRGTDILTALALGARAVLVGRAHLYGFAAAGEAGVRHAVDILSEELRTAMALSGVTTLSEIDRRLVRHRDGDQKESYHDPSIPPIPA